MSRAILLTAASVAVVAAVLLAAHAFSPIERELMPVEEAIELLQRLLLLSLLLERAQEVVVATWRDPGKGRLELITADLRRQLQTEDDAARDSRLEAIARNEALIRDYRAGTARLARALGFAAGLTISALGVRILSDVVGVPGGGAHGVQALLFQAFDIGLTGALLAGGSDGIHQLVGLITDSLFRTRERVRAG